MDIFSFEEVNLLCIYNGGNRSDTMAALVEMREHLAKDERELLSLTDSSLKKLRNMSDSEFEQLELFPDFEV